MTATTIESKHFPFLRAIGIRKRFCKIFLTTHVTLTGLNWSGGSISRYTAVRLSDFTTSSPNLSGPPPWANPHEGLRIPIPLGFAIIEHGVFCGKPAIPYIYVNPSETHLLPPCITKLMSPRESSPAAHTESPYSPSNLEA